MAVARTSEDRPRRCMVCREEVAEKATRRAGKCAQCGNQLELMKEQPATILLAAFPILDQQTMDVFERIADAISHTEPSRLDLDFSGVTFLTSAALGKLMMLTKVAKSKGIPITLHNLDSNIREVVEITGLKRLLAPGK